MSQEQAEDDKNFILQDYFTEGLDRLQAIFSDAASGRRWLSTPHPKLDNQIPFTFIRTKSGMNKIIKLAESNGN